MKKLFTQVSLASFLTSLALPVVASAQSGYVTRAEFVSLLIREEGIAESGSYCFQDVKNEWFAAAVCAAKQQGIVRGAGDGKFYPSQFVTLIDASVMIVRAEGETVQSDSVWYRPYIEQLIEWEAIPTSIRSINTPLTTSEVTDLLNAVNGGRGSDSSSDRGEDTTLRISVSDRTPESGDSITYNIRITNESNDDVRTDVTATLDNDMEFVRGSSDPDEDDEDITWEDVRIPEDSTKTLTLTVRIDSSADDGDDLRLRVEADDAEASMTVTVDDDNDNDDDDDEDDDSDDDTSGDLQMSIDESDDPLEPNDVLTYRIRIENHGDDDDRVDLDALLDEDVTFISASDDGVHSGEHVYWDNIDVDEDETKTVTVAVRIDSSAKDGDRIDLFVEAEGKDDDADASEVTRVDDDNDNDDSDDDVSITITDIDDPVEPGQTITYHVVIRNRENSAISVDARAFLDDETSFSSASDNGRLIGDDEVEWEDISIARDSSKTLVLGVRPRSSVDDGDSVTIRVEAEDEEDSETTHIEEDDDDNDDNDEGDVQVSITDTPDPAEPGETITYTIRLTNDDSDDARVDLIAELDDQTTFVSATRNGDEDDGEVTWDNLEIEGDDDITITLKARVRSSADDGDSIRLRVRTDDDSDTEETEIED